MGEVSLPGVSDEEGFPRLDPSRLRGFERLAVRVCDHVNRVPRRKRRVQRVMLSFAYRFVRGATRRRWRVAGLEHPRQIEAPRGTILVSNHRSFFDMYVLSAVLLDQAPFFQRLYFPVRSRYFYTNPFGLLINLFFSGFAMWPPVFRDDRRAALNPTGLRQLAYVLRDPGAMVGFHPEGSRGKGPDPFALMGAKPGVGHLLLACHPDTLVLPAFIHGLSNSTVQQITLGYAPWAPEGDPIHVRFGAPVRAGDLVRDDDAHDLAARVLGLVASLGSAEQSLAQLPSEPIGLPQEGEVPPLDR